MAANIVDFVVEDEISTPFLFYTAEDYRDLPLKPQHDPDPGRPLPNRTGPPGQWPMYWVFGTETPKSLIQTVQTQIGKNDPDHAYTDLVQVSVLLSDSDQGSMSGYRMQVGVNSPLVNLPMQLGSPGAAILPGVGWQRQCRGKPGPKGRASDRRCPPAIPPLLLTNITSESVNRTIRPMSRTGRRRRHFAAIGKPVSAF